MVVRKPRSTERERRRRSTGADVRLEGGSFRVQSYGETNYDGGRSLTGINMCWVESRNGGCEYRQNF